MRKAAIILFALLCCDVFAAFTLPYVGGYRGDRNLVELAALGQLAYPLLFLSLLGLSIATLFLRRHRRFIFGLLVAGLIVPIFGVVFQGRFNVVNGARDRMVKDFGAEKLRAIAHQIAEKSPGPNEAFRVPPTEMRFARFAKVDFHRMVNIFWGGDIGTWWGVWISLNGPVKIDPTKHPEIRYLPIAEDIVVYQN